VPAMTRVSGYGTLLFELAGLSSQLFGPHLCYSAYSLTLQLALHPEIGGWDTDVIAEDHHMFCKCFFAPLWTQAEELVESRKKGVALPPIEAKLTVQAIYLPAVSYLVESKAGYVASVRARFVQARRHAEGMAEIGYLVLQYVKLISTVGFAQVSGRTHVAVFSVFWSMVTVHIINTVQAFSLVCASIIAAPTLASWVLGGGLATTIMDIGSNGILTIFGSLSSFQIASQALLFAFGPLPPIAFGGAMANYIVVRDMLEGQHSGPQPNKDTPPHLQKKTRAGKLGWWEKYKLFTGIQFDMSVLAEPCVFAYGLAPAILASYSILRRGCKFQYVVAAKPVSE